MLDTSVIAALFTSCENETDTVKSGESSFDNVVVDPYQDLTLAIETVNSHYEGSYLTRGTRWWQYVFGVLGFPFADALGGATPTYNSKDGWGVSISGQNAVKTSKEWWAWSTQDLDANNGTTGTTTGQTAPRRATGRGSITVTVNTQALPEINGNKLEDNYGFLHNKAIIDLYGLYGEDLKTMSDEDFSAVLSAKIENIIQEYSLVSYENAVEGVDCSTQIATICYEKDNISDIIMACKELNPSLAKEYDILAIAFGELIANCFPEDIVYQYTQEISQVVDQSLLTEDSKRMIKASVSIFGASSQLWEVEEN